MVKRFVYLVLIVLVLAVAVSRVDNVVCQVDEATAKLQEANACFVRAFCAVEEAEQAGANVSVLLVQLNIAADSLAGAEMACRRGDLAAALNRAEGVISAALDVEAEAAAIKAAAVAEYANYLRFSAVLSAAGASAFVIALWFGWKRFKHWYVEKLLNAEPKVVDQ
ncbi:MAG: hypothetical protein QXZ70_08650 [Candidatus Bathyarchaeia archaeon]